MYVSFNEKNRTVSNDQNIHIKKRAFFSISSKQFTQKSKYTTDSFVTNEIESSSSLHNHVNLNNISRCCCGFICHCNVC
jgi:hypothetical protein